MAYWRLYSSGSAQARASALIHIPGFVKSRRCPVLDSLVFSLAVGMSIADTSGRTIANLGDDIVQFERPMFPGDSLYAESEVLEKRESACKPGRGIVTIETRGFNQNRERVIVPRRRYLAPKRDTK